MRNTAITIASFVVGMGFGSAAAQLTPYGQEIYQQGPRSNTTVVIRPASPYGQSIDTQTPSRPAWSDPQPTQRYDIDTRRDTRAPATELDRRYGYGR